MPPTWTKCYRLQMLNIFRVRLTVFEYCIVDITFNTMAWYIRQLRLFFGCWHWWQRFLNHTRNTLLSTHCYTQTLIHSTLLQYQCKGNLRTLTLIIQYTYVPEWFWAILFLHHPHPLETVLQIASQLSPTFAQYRQFVKQGICFVMHFRTYGNISLDIVHVQYSQC